MAIDTPLYTAEDIYLTSIDHDKDAEVESRWTHQAQYLRMLQRDPAQPQAPVQVKKRYEKIEKDADERRNRFYYAVRTRADERLIGFSELYWVDWANGSAWVRLGIGETADWHKGYGTQVLRTLLNYAFNELNLYRLSAMVAEYNTAGLALFQKLGFVEEVRQPEALNRFRRRWDNLILGLLHEEWTT